MSLPTGAALGSTRDPQALVVGVPGVVEDRAAQLRQRSRGFEDLGEDLQAVRTPSWAGAACEVFYGRYQLMPPAWFRLAQTMADCATALETYAEALRTAQSRAEDAIDRWEQGEEETRRARAAWQEATAQALRPVNGIAPGANAVGPFVDTGQALREEARQILQEARDALDQAGAGAAAVLRPQPAASPVTSEAGAASGRSGDWWGAGGSTQGPGWQRSLDDQGKVTERFRLGRAEGYAYLFRGQDTYEKDIGPGTFTSTSTVDAGVARGSLGGHLDEDGLRLRGDGLLGVGATSEQRYTLGENSNVYLRGDAAAGMMGDVDVEIAPDRVHAGGEALAGGKIRFEGAGETQGVGIRGGAEGWVGYGAAADLGYDYDDGRLTLDYGAGVAFKAGGKLDGSLTLDFPAIADSALATSRVVRGWVD